MFVPMINFHASVSRLRTRSLICFSPEFTPLVASFYHALRKKGYVTTLPLPC